MPDGRRSDGQMKVVNVSEWKQGMRLARAVQNGQGVLLLNEGVELSDKSIWILKSWGVTSLCVETDDNEDPGHTERSDEVDREIARRVEDTFRDVADDEVMAEIMAAAIRHIQKRHEPSGTGDGIG